jgi:threonine synthase
LRPYSFLPRGGRMDLICMNDELIKNRVGRTPIIRAKRLEKELDIGKIYLKLEGNNPSGHREDRMAYLMIRDALSRGKDTICLGTYGTVGGSLSYLTKEFPIKCVFYVPNKKKTLRKDLLEDESVKIIEHGRTYEDCVRESRRVSRENGWYDANPGLANNMTNLYSFSYIAEELNRQLDEQIDTVFCQTSSGSSISGLHLGFKQLWVTEDIEKMPRIFSVSTSHGNAIVESYSKGSRDIITLDPTELKASKFNRTTLNWKCYNGQDALNAIFDTNGAAVGVSDEELRETAGLFRKKERLRFSSQNSFPIAAFMKSVKNGDIEKGTHVLILNDGRVGLDIRKVSKKELNIPYDKFLDLLDEWLIQFTDPREEIIEATDNAFKKGHVICAFKEGTIVGIAVLSHSNWDVFFPHYHLSYIATRRNLKGMGIATQLMEKAIDLSKGSLSLHVEVDNKRAIKLYEKMGLKKKYYRMLYMGGE